MSIFHPFLWFSHMIEMQHYCKSQYLNSFFLDPESINIYLLAKGRIVSDIPQTASHHLRASSASNEAFWLLSLPLWLPSHSLTLEERCKNQPFPPRADLTTTRNRFVRPCKGVCLITTRENIFLLWKFGRFWGGCMSVGCVRVKLAARKSWPEGTKQLEEVQKVTGEMRLRLFHTFQTPVDGYRWWSHAKSESRWSHPRLDMALYEY